MSNKLEAGFVMADSRNLPKIDIFMVTDFIKKSDKFNAAEVRNVKLARSAREEYGDQAIGYVCLTRDGKICTVKCRVCPEHRVQAKGYNVSLVLDEDDDKIIDVHCHDCAAANGGCKHAIAFLMWLHRRSEEPSVTDTTCYWKKSVLSKVGTTKKFITVDELANKNPSSSTVLAPDTSKSFLQEFLNISIEKGIESQISQHHFLIKEREVSCLSIHQLLIQFKATGKNSADDFILFANNLITTKLCLQAEKMTRSQADSSLWFELRYGRITASKLYEVCQCKTYDGSLVNQIIGAQKVRLNQYMQRGKDLEEKVLAALKKKEQFSCTNSGLMLLPSWPIFGASPDAVGKDFIVEIKCPAKEKTVKNYISNNTIQPKYKAQMQLQMLATNTKKGYLCVADYNFEETKKVTVILEDYDEPYVMELIEKSAEFWKKYIFPKLYETVA